MTRGFGYCRMVWRCWTVVARPTSAHLRSCLLAVLVSWAHVRRARLRLARPVSRPRLGPLARVQVQGVAQVRTLHRVCLPLSLAVLWSYRPLVSHGKPATDSKEWRLCRLDSGNRRTVRKVCAPTGVKTICSSDPSVLPTKTPCTHRGTPLAKSFMFGHLANTHSPNASNSPKKSCPLMIRNGVVLLVLTCSRAIAHATCRTIHGNKRCVLRMSTWYCSDKTLTHVRTLPAICWFTVSPSARDWEEYLGLCHTCILSCPIFLRTVLASFMIAGSWSVWKVNCFQPSPNNQVSKDFTA